MKNSKKNFVHKPEYPGGRESFKKFLKENLVYPQEAIQNEIEGTVFLMAEVNDNGMVLDVKVENGIGYGCDEEAIRLVKMMKYGEVKNRGLRVKITKKIRINFKLAEHKPKKTSFNYSYKEKPKNRSEQVTRYEYTIQLPPREN